MKTGARFFHAFLLVAIVAGSGPTFAARKGKITQVDLTKGEAIPEGATHDWTLGATGCRGWMFSDKLETTGARQIVITRLDKGSPADGILAVGDVILGVGGKPFLNDARVEFGKALTAAESEAGDGNLTISRWRSGVSSDIVVKLPVLGNYSSTAPYDCPKSRIIYEQGCKSLAQRMGDSTYAKRQNPITRSLNALALLASGNPAYLPMVRKEVEWASNYSANSFQTWYYAYVIMLLAEYQIATGDDMAMPGLKRLALEAAMGKAQSARGGTSSLSQMDGSVVMA
jgi:hypothetical protein